MAGIIFADYDSSAQKQDAALAKRLYAKKGLNAEQKAIIAKEWKTFRSESELKIKDHEIRINRLNAKMGKQGVMSDAFYKKKIAYLEPQIKYMKERLENYDKAPSNWEEFKYGFGHEMDEIENALNDLTADNKK